MTPFVYEIIGFGGSVIVVAGHLPQLMHIFREKSASGVSPFAWFVWSVGDLMLFLYSINIQDHVFIFLNGLNLLFATLIFLTAMFFRLKEKVS